MSDVLDPPSPTHSNKIAPNPGASVSYPLFSTRSSCYRYVVPPCAMRDCIFFSPPTNQDDINKDEIMRLQVDAAMWEYLQSDQITSQVTSFKCVACLKHGRVLGKGSM